MESLLAHNLIVGAGTMAAGVLGIAFQSLASHQLRPSDYGGVFAVVTLVTSIGLPATAFTLLMARETSRARATGHLAPSAVLLRRGNQALLLLGAVLGILIVGGSPLLSRFLDVPQTMLLAAALGVPFAIALPLVLGELQGEERFTEFATLLAGQALIKLVGALLLGRWFGPVGMIAGISLASIAIYACGLVLVRRKLAVRAKLPWLRPAVEYLLVVVPSTLALASLLSADVLLAKHYFSGAVAGNYAVVAAIGRAIFWGANGIAIVLFPKATFRRAQGASGVGVVAASMALVALGAVAGFALLSVASTPLIRAFAGTAYAGGDGLLPWYAVGMGLLGLAAVLIAALQSHGRPGFLAVLIPLAALEPVLIALFHRTALQMVQVMDISMAVAAAGLAAWWLFTERDRFATPAFVAKPKSPMVPVVEVRAER